MIPENNLKPENMPIVYHPLRKFHTHLSPDTAAPRQGILQPENQCTIELNEEYSEALSDLEKYNYIIVLYHMHMSGKWSAMVRPPGSKKSFGLFATRSPSRPNPIGFAVIKVDRVDGTTLQVRGIDAYDGTPVLDIKPWIPSIDCPSDKCPIEMKSELGLGD